VAACTPRYLSVDQADGLSVANRCWCACSPLTGEPCSVPRLTASSNVKQRRSGWLEWQRRNGPSARRSRSAWVDLRVRAGTQSHGHPHVRYVSPAVASSQAAGHVSAATASPPLPSAQSKARTALREMLVAGRKRESRARGSGPKRERQGPEGQAPILPGTRRCAGLERWVHRGRSELRAAVSAPPLYATGTEARHWAEA
jgi:hypothetical protein